MKMLMTATTADTIAAVSARRAESAALRSNSRSTMDCRKESPAVLPTAYSFSSADVIFVASRAALVRPSELFAIPPSLQPGRTAIAARIHSSEARPHIGCDSKRCRVGSVWQRVIVDFAADQPFAQARAKLQEHYGFAIGESTIQRITFAHAQAMYEAGHEGSEFPETPGLRKPIIVETDGGMVPIVEPSCEGKDKRKGKTLSWREAKLSLAHAQGSRTPVYAGSIEGGVEEAGRQLLSCAVRAGFGANSRVHAVGDGAPWIVGQVEEQFGDQGRYLIDFYHVCEYLGAASEAIAPNPAARSAWMETQKEALKGGRLDAVLRALAGHCEPPEVDDEHAPVRTCHRYLSARANHLNYRQALADGLPIGSGEIESAHRYVAQQRLKRPGAWWRVEHAEYMLALRINRINGDWDVYWKALAQPSSTVANDNNPQKSLRRTA